MSKPSFEGELTMKITRADGSVIEGTAEELAQYEALAKFHATGPKSQDAESLAAVDWEFVSSDVGFRALTRIKLGSEAKAVLQALHAAGDQWTSAKSLQDLVGYKPASFAGLMGAFGRRVANTPGYVRDSSFFEYEWDGNQSCYLYRLPPSTRSAVERARIVE
jgi:hypothetical protein